MPAEEQVPGRAEGECGAHVGDCILTG
jgi:hypothetical protein